MHPKLLIMKVFCKYYEKEEEKDGGEEEDQEEKEWSKDKKYMVVS